MAQVKDWSIARVRDVGTIGEVEDGGGGES